MQQRRRLCAGMALALSLVVAASGSDAAGDAAAAEGHVAAAKALAGEDFKDSIF